MRTMKARARWEGGHRTTLDDGRGHTVTVDLPLDEQGDNLGPSALELNVMSFAGCITTIFALVAKKRRLTFEAMSVELEGRRPAGSPTITGVDGEFRIVTSAPPEDVEATLNITLRTCPVGVLYEEAHIPVRVGLTIVPASSHRIPLPMT